VQPCHSHITVLFRKHQFQPAIDRLKIERDETAQKSLILLLWYAQTNAADGAISSFAADTSKSSTARDYAQKIMQNKDKIGAKACRGTGSDRGFVAPEAA